MLIKTLLILTISVFGYALSTSGQTVNIASDTIQWQATGFTDVLSSETVNIPCQFITYGTQRVEWIQGDGNYTIAFVVTATDGSWDNVAQPGSFTITLGAESLTGEITLTDSGGTKSARLVLTGGSADISNTYSITSFEKL